MELNRDLVGIPEIRKLTALLKQNVTTPDDPTGTMKGIGGEGTPKP